MKDNLFVKAGPNGPVHFEGTRPGNRRLDKNGKDTWIIGDEPVEVPNTRYYRRRLQVGDLVPCDMAARGVETAAKKK